MVEIEGITAVSDSVAQHFDDALFVQFERKALEKLVFLHLIAEDAALLHELWLCGTEKSLYPLCVEGELHVVLRRCAEFISLLLGEVRYDEVFQRAFVEFHLR